MKRKIIGIKLWIDGSNKGNVLALIKNGLIDPLFVYFLLDIETHVN